MKTQEISFIRLFHLKFTSFMEAADYLSLAYFFLLAASWSGLLGINVSNFPLLTSYSLSSSYPAGLS
jgi:hypothetical protein